MTSPQFSPAGRTDPDQEHYRILLVEDDAGDALLVEELLADTKLGHSLTWVPTMAAAMDQVGRAAPDCILLDLHLPDAHGVPAVTAVQAACPHAAVVVLTGLAETTAGSQAVAGGAQDYLVKGHVEPELLTRVIRYAVHRKAAERATAELRENRLQAAENIRLERGLLPAPLLRTDDVTATTRYLPGRQRALLGGDFLDVVQTADGQVHAVIGDVSGHGADEAALGVCLRITWRALTLSGQRGTALLSYLEQVMVAERPRADMFTTVTTVAIDPAARRATLHLAGHHEPLLLTGRTAQQVSCAHGIALGVAPGLEHWPATTADLPPSGALLLYTDGLTEGYRGPGSERLDVTGLIELITQAAPRPTDVLLDQVVSSAQTLNAGRHADDLAVLHLAWR
ncbi:PP2C family protein-serine/threonine phosphatase [Streptacidiphilus sp. PAMC 29251]